MACVMASIDCTSKQRANADGNENDIPCVKSELGFTLYYEISDNKPIELLQVVAISNENERLHFVEECLMKSTLDINEQDFEDALQREAERIFEHGDDYIALQELHSKSPKESCRPICQFFLKGKCRFGDKCLNTHENEAIKKGEDDIDNPASHKNKTANDRTKSQAGKSSGKIVENEKQCKKPPMKTATAVINRILWDEQLNPEDFTVGYLDRFLGIVENTFNSFDWEDVTSVDPTILAIPKHRIQYFKYCDEVVWNKNKRFDNVFGSTGSGLTIIHIIGKNKQQDTLESDKQVVENS